MWDYNLDLNQHSIGLKNACPYLTKLHQNYIAVIYENIDYFIKYLQKAQLN